MFKLNIPLVLLIRIFVLATFLVTAVQLSAFAAWKDLQVINHTGFEIKRLYISSSGSDSWGKDLLGSKYTLANGDSTTISYNGEYTYYDLRIVFMNDSYREWTGDQRLNFKNAWRITIFRDGTESNGAYIFSVSKN